VSSGSPFLGSLFEYITYKTLQNGEKFDIHFLEKYHITDYNNSDAKVDLS